MWTFLPEARQEIETTLGYRLPDPSTPEFDQLLGRLQREQPELARKVLGGLRSAPSVTLPSERVARQWRRRGYIRAALTRLLYKPAWPDDLVVDRRRVLGLALVVFAGLFVPAVYLMNASAISGSRLPAASRSAKTLGLAGVAPGSTTTSTAAPSRTVPRASPQGAPPVSISTPSVPPPPASPEGPLGFLLPEVPAAPGAFFRRLPPASLGSSSGIDRVVPHQSRIEVPASAQRVFAFVDSEDLPPTPRVFVFVRAEETAHAPQSAGLTSPAPESSPFTRQPAVPAPMAAAPGADSSQPDQAAPVSGQLSWQLGQVVAAHLVTGIATTMGLEPIPVLATTRTPRWCGRDTCPPVTWLGQATYPGGGRIQAQFTAAIVEGRMHAIRAQAFGVDMIAGIPAQISTKTPALAAQLVGAAFAAAGDYLNAVSQQQHLTITNGWLTVAHNGAPDFWSHLLGRVAGMFGFQPGGPGTVQVAEAGPNTELRLLIIATEGR